MFAYKFDTFYQSIFENADIDSVPLLDEQNYQPRGGTALYGSLGKTIVSIGNRLSLLKESERPEKVLFVTITDGEHNSDLENAECINYTSEQIKEMIKHQSEVYSWDFAYIGANQDSWSVGSNIGYKAGTTLDYDATAKGTAQAFQLLSRSAVSYRSAAVGAKFNFVKPEEDKQD